MQRRSFLVALSSLLGVKQARTRDAQEREPTQYLTAGRTHTLIASEVADGVTFRRSVRHPGVAIEFKRYDLRDEIFRSSRLSDSETSAGVYVRGKVPFSLRLFQSGDPVSQLVTGVVFVERARISVFSEREPEWTSGISQVIVVATPAIRV